LSRGKGRGTSPSVGFRCGAGTIELDHFTNAQTVQELQSLISSDAHGEAVINFGHNDSITLANVTTPRLQRAILAGHVVH